MAELSFRPQWLLSNSSKGYFPASGWMLVDKTPKLGTQLIPGHPRATMQGALAPWEAASMVHVGTSPRAPLLSSAWWLTPSSPGCSPYGQSVWATLPWVSVRVLPLFPRQCFCKASSPEETHHWSSDLPTEITSSIESENILSWKRSTRNIESKSHVSPCLEITLPQGLCRGNVLMPSIATHFLLMPSSCFYL